MVLFSRTTQTNGSPLAELKELPATHYVEKLATPCPCKDDLLCLPLAEAMNKNPTAPHVLNYIKKSEKKEVW